MVETKGIEVPAERAPAGSGYGRLGMEVIPRTVR
jgi:hypothetical protein